jgi:adenylate cyclase
LHVWAVREGLCGTAPATLFEGLCRRLAGAGVPLWRAFIGIPTLHPQWGGYAYTWWRDRDVIEPVQFERGEVYEQEILSSPIGYLVRQAEAYGEVYACSGDPWRHLRRRLAGPEAQLDFPVLEGLAAAGATDYFAQIVRFGAGGDPSRGTGVGHSFATDRPEGFRDDDLSLLEAVLPVVSLAMMAHAGHTIASGLLEAYLGADAGKRVHTGSVERGSVENIRAVLWYADIRSFTTIADATPGLVTIELLNSVFEVLTAALRPRGGQVLKFIGDGMLATFSFTDATREDTCCRALDAAADATDALDALNVARRVAGKPVAAVDLALHVGEVLYGNIGAAGRLDFTCIGPAVNLAARLEKIVAKLGRTVIASERFAQQCPADLETLGEFSVAGFASPQTAYGLRDEAGGATAQPAAIREAGLSPAAP